ncbi:T9SS type A sorting domain-containing protein [candidate division GN15 bacterium]|nr:T9SS type A sorting domain-containing protein [candidate division GN15 bacterium]
MRTVLCLAVVSLVLLVSTGTAQITIATNDYQPPIGSQVEYVQVGGVTDSLFTAAGDGSGSLTWPFTGLSTTLPYNGTVVEVATVPLIDSFPAANVAIRYPFGTDTSWTILRSVATSFTNLGSVTHSSTAGIFASKPDSLTPEYLFPMDYGDTWQAREFDRSVSSPSVYSLSFDTTDYEVDAYGTVSWEGNAVPCLRVRAHRRQITDTYLNDTLFATTVHVTHRIEFIAEGFDILLTLSRDSLNGVVTYSGQALGSFVDSPTDVVENDPGSLPGKFELGQNYPNPFNPTTEIRFSLPEATSVRLSVYNILGQRITRLVDRHLSAGAYTVDWDGTNRNGQPVASGIYLYRLETGHYSDTKKMLLIK